MSRESNCGSRSSSPRPTSAVPGASKASRAMVLALTTVPLALTSTNASGSASSMAARRAAPRDGLLLTRRFLPVTAPCRPREPSCQPVRDVSREGVYGQWLRSRRRMRGRSHVEGTQNGRRRRGEPVTVPFRGPPSRGPARDPVSALPTRPRDRLPAHPCVPNSEARARGASQRAISHPSPRVYVASTGRPAQVPVTCAVAGPPYCIVHIAVRRGRRERAPCPRRSSGPTARRRPGRRGGCRPPDDSPARTSRPCRRPPCSRSR